MAEQQILSFWAAEKDSTGDLYFVVHADDAAANDAARQRIRCHWFVAAPHSPLLAAKRPDPRSAQLREPLTVVVAGVAPRDLQRLVEYFYGRPLPPDLDLDGLLALKKIAEKLEVTTLEEACRSWFRRNTRVEWVWEALGEAIRSRDVQMEQRYLEVVRTVPAVFQIEGRRFESLPFEAVLKVVQLDALSVAEEQLFRFVKTFLESKSNEEFERNQILRHLRFPAMASTFFYTDVVTSGVLSLEESRSLSRHFDAGDSSKLSVKKRDLPSFAVVVGKDCRPMTVGYFKNDKIHNLKYRIRSLTPLEEFVVQNSDGKALTNDKSCADVLKTGSVLKIVKMIQLQFEPLRGQTTKFSVKEDEPFSEIRKRLPLEKGETKPLIIKSSREVLSPKTTPETAGLSSGDVVTLLISQSEISDASRPASSQSRRSNESARPASSQSNVSSNSARVSLRQSPALLDASGPSSNPTLNLALPSPNPSLPSSLPSIDSTDPAIVLVVPHDDSEIFLSDDESGGRGAGESVEGWSEQDWKKILPEKNNMGEGEVNDGKSQSDWDTTNPTTDHVDVKSINPELKDDWNSSSQNLAEWGDESSLNQSQDWDDYNPVDLSEQGWDNFVPPPHSGETVKALQDWDDFPPATHRNKKKLGQGWDDFSSESSSVGDFGKFKGGKDVITSSARKDKDVKDKGDLLAKINDVPKKSFAECAASKPKTPAVPAKPTAPAAQPKTTKKNRSRAASKTREPPKQHPLYKTQLCHFYLYQTCPDGPRCQFAHGKEELRVFKKGLSQSLNNLAFSPTKK